MPLPVETLCRHHLRKNQLRIVCAFEGSQASSIPSAPIGTVGYRSALLPAILRSVQGMGVCIPNHFGGIDSNVDGCKNARSLHQTPRTSNI